MRSSETRRYIKTAAEASALRRQIAAGYERMIESARVRNVSEFRAYCDKWGADFDGLMSEARGKLAAEDARREARFAERLAARRRAR